MSVVKSCSFDGVSSASLIRLSDAHYHHRNMKTVVKKRYNTTGRSFTICTNEAINMDISANTQCKWHFASLKVPMLALSLTHFNC